jgi:hypothetical protein
MIYASVSQPPWISSEFEPEVLPLGGLVLMTREGKSNNAMHGLSEFERAYYC